MPGHPTAFTGLPGTKRQLVSVAVPCNRALPLTSNRDRGVSLPARALPETAVLRNLTTDTFQKIIVKSALALKQRGWAVVDGVLSRADCDVYLEGLWQWLEGLGTGISRHDPSSWKQPQWPPSTRGIINSLGVAHEPFVWRVRKHPRLRQVFAALWGTNELLSSFDSINALPPAAEPPPTASWLHTDQSPTRRGACCIQGLVNMVDVDASSTGTILLKDGSHSHHQRFFEDGCKLGKEAQQEVQDFYIFPDNEVAWFDQFATVTPSGSQGSLFLWDSRTAHANVLPRSTDRWRHVVYACYQPRALATEQDLDVKRTAWRDFRVTTHWPAQQVSLFPEGGTDYYGAQGDNGLVELPQHRRTSSRGKEEDTLCRQLAGVAAYPSSDTHGGTALLDLSEEELEHMLAELEQLLI